MEKNQSKMYPDVGDGFFTYRAEQHESPVSHDNFLTVVTNKEKMFLEARILDDDLSKIYFTIDKEEKEWIDNHGVLSELKGDFNIPDVENPELINLCLGESIQPPAIAESYTKAIAKYYHNQTKHMFNHLKEKKILLPLKNGIQLNESEGKLCYPEQNEDKAKSNVDVKSMVAVKSTVDIKSVVDVKSTVNEKSTDEIIDAFAEIDKITWLLNKEMDSLPEEYVMTLGNFVQKIVAARLLNCIIYSLDTASAHSKEGFTDNVHHRQMMFSFAILYRLCKHGRRLEKSVVQVGRFIEGTKKLKLYKETIESLLNGSNMKDIPVVVMSGYGSPRCGKSFFLNLMAKYCEKLILQAESGEITDNFELDSEDEVTGFKSDSDEHPVTKGLWMWREPLIIENKQRKVALIIMDSEGVGHADSNFSPLIIPFTCLHMSDVCINNVRTCPSKDDLACHLAHQFIETKDLTHSRKPFGHLIMLYRDASPKEGFFPGLADETSKTYETWKKVGNAFIKAERFYLCHPGDPVLKCTVKVKEIKENFKTLCYVLFNVLFGLEGDVFNYGCKRTDIIQRFVEFEKILEDLPDFPTMDELCKQSYRSKAVDNCIASSTLRSAKDLGANVNDEANKLEKDHRKLFGDEVAASMVDDYYKKVDSNTEMSGLWRYLQKFGENNLVNVSEEDTRHPEKEIMENSSTTLPVLPGDVNGEVTKSKTSIVTVRPSAANQDSNVTRKTLLEPNQLLDELSEKSIESQADGDDQTTGYAHSSARSQENNLSSGAQLKPERTADEADSQDESGAETNLEVRFF